MPRSARMDAPGCPPGAFCFDNTRKACCDPFMPSFGKRSLAALATVHPDLRRVAMRAILTYDFTVLCGSRGRVEQERAFAAGNSFARFGQSPHNYTPALAFDAAPYPIDWNNELRFRELGKHIKAAAEAEGVSITWGGDWIGRKRDLPHYQLSNWKELKGVLAE